MKKILTVTIGILFCMSLPVQNTYAQDAPNPTHNIELSLGMTSNGQLGGLGYWQEWGLGKTGAWKLGYGVRFTGYFGKDVTHISAPPEFYTDETMQDSVFVASPQMSNIALYIGAGYVIKEKFELGFNIDALGYTFGGDKDATFTSEGNETATTVNPGSITALLLGPNDIGMVRSDFFAGYKFSDTWKVRLGLGPLFTEYRTDTELQTGNTRYRGASMMILASVTYTLGS